MQRRHLLPLLLSVPLLCAARTAATAPTLDLQPLLGQDFAGYEEVLGTPVRTLPHGSREYRAPGLEKIFLARTGTSQKPMMNVILVFPRDTGTTWQNALVRVGLSPEKLRPVRSAGTLNLARGDEYFCYLPPAKGRRITQRGVSFDGAIHLFRGSPNPTAFALLLIETPITVGRPAPIDLRTVLGQGFDAYEKVLGEPVERIGDNGIERRLYRRDGLTRVQLQRTAQPIVTEVQIGFSNEKIRSWKEALARVGLPTEGVTATKSDYTYVVEGALPAGWSLTWVPNNPEHTGEHTLLLAMQAGGEKP